MATYPTTIGTNGIYSHKFRQRIFKELGNGSDVVGRALIGPGLFTELAAIFEKHMLWAVKDLKFSFASLANRLNGDGVLYVAISRDAEHTIESVDTSSFMDSMTRIAFCKCVTNHSAMDMAFDSRPLYCMASGKPRLERPGVMYYAVPVASKEVIWECWAEGTLEFYLPTLTQHSSLNVRVTLLRFAQAYLIGVSGTEFVVTLPKTVIGEEGAVFLFNAFSKISFTITYEDGSTEVITTDTFPGIINNGNLQLSFVFSGNTSAINTLSTLASIQSLSFVPVEYIEE